MATVSTETIYCFHTEFKRVVRYKSRYGKFYITLPAGVPEEEVESDTEAGAIKAFNAAVEMYEKSITEKTKVILYGYTVDACIYGPNDEQGRTKIIFNSLDDCEFGEIFRKDGVSLSLWVGVYDKAEIVLDGKVENYITYDAIESSIPESLASMCRISVSRFNSPDFQEIPWTDDTEQFFVDIALAFERLVLKLNGVFGDKEQVIKFAANRQNLLSGI